MELLNPLMLWGTLGIAIPVAIHFWHQKKGKYYPWAAMQWLSEKNLQQAKGLRFDEWWLLLLRCLAIVLLCLFLSKPILLNPSPISQAKSIHLVEPSAWVYENYKFEIASALQKGESCFWLTQPLTAVDPNQQPPQSSWSAQHFQAILNAMNFPQSSQLHLYFTNTQMLASLPHLYVPMPYTLHTVAASVAKKQGNYIQFSENQFITLNESGALITQNQAPSNKQLVHSGSLSFFMPKQHPNEKYLLAALQALHQVYGFSFKRVAKVADASIAFEASPSQALTFVSKPIYANSPVVILPETWQDMAFSGQLPVFIGEHIIKHLQLKTFDNPLSSKQLQALFALQPYHPRPTQSTISDILLGILLLVIGLERWLALQKNS